MICEKVKKKLCCILTYLNVNSLLIYLKSFIYRILAFLCYLYNSPIFMLSY